MKNWNQFCDEMLALVKIQYQEMEKAVVRIGEYRFQDKFTYLEESSSVWTGMSIDQRKRHMKKVMSVMMTGVTVAHGDDEDPVSLERDGHEINSLPVPSNLSSVVWDRMVSKAKFRSCINVTYTRQQQ